MRLDFVLPSGPNTFMDLLAAHLARCGACARRRSRACRCIESTGFSPEALAASLRELKGVSDGVGDHRHRPSPRPRGDPRGGRRRHAGPDPGLRHRACAAPRLCRHRQPQCRPPRGPPARPLRAWLGGRGGAVRGLAQLSRPRGARDGLSPHPRRGLPEPADRRAARGPRRSGAQLPRGRPPAAGRPELRGIYNIGAGNRGIARALEESGPSPRGRVHRPRADRAHPPLPALRHHGRGHRPEPPCGGARGDRAAAASRRGASTGRTRCRSASTPSFARTFPRFCEDQSEASILEGWSP